MKSKIWMLLFGVLLIGFLLLFLFNRDIIHTISKEEKQEKIIEAIISNDIEELNNLLSKNYPVNFISEEGYTPLETAMNHGSFECTIALLHKGAKLREEPLIPLFIQLVYMFDDYKQLKESMDYEEVVSQYIVLLKTAIQAFPEQLGETDEYGNTALHIAATKGHPEVINRLIEFNINSNELNRAGETAFIMAVKSGQMEVVKQLFTKVQDTEQMDVEENSPLIQAVLNGRTEIVQFLLNQNKQNINDTNKIGQTALIIAADYGYKEIVEILLENGADPSIKSIDGKTASEYATRWGHEDIAALLK
ncbi:ankyrin repeat domain-containing protein [Bacillus sp. FJAT-29790]|uniref:ankyrin repeat domain-containing protein n=1 Tax=Bacillus sp. FJAT-29790 TaxID=1895002 RepID=UPI001C2247CC|nr:ankyrin repeat domain-containing protein [Bacillus sp. FJAT-29790]MBU8879576.1 ankyrin repeat domain-containing protein [Bacillus sp. FJAT-29790]